MGKAKTSKTPNLTSYSGSRKMSTKLGIKGRATPTLGAMNSLAGINESNPSTLQGSINPESQKRGDSPQNIFNSMLDSHSNNSHSESQEVPIKHPISSIDPFLLQGSKATSSVLFGFTFRRESSSQKSRSTALGSPLSSSLPPPKRIVWRNHRLSKKVRDYKRIQKGEFNSEEEDNEEASIGKKYHVIYKKKPKTRKLK